MARSFRQQLLGRGLITFLAWPADGWSTPVQGNIVKAARWGKRAFHRTRSDSPFGGSALRSVGTWVPTTISLTMRPSALRGLAMNHRECRKTMYQQSVLWITPSTGIAHIRCEKPQIPDSNPLAFPFEQRSIHPLTPFVSHFGFGGHRSRAPYPIFALPSAHALFPRSSHGRRCALSSSHPCTSGHLDAIPASNIKFPAISHSAFEVNSALALGATPEDGVGSAVYADSTLVTARALHNWDDCAR